MLETDERPMVFEAEKIRGIGSPPRDASPLIQRVGSDTEPEDTELSVIPNVINEIHIIAVWLRRGLQKKVAWRTSDLVHSRLETKTGSTCELK